MISGLMPSVEKVTVFFVFVYGRAPVVHGPGDRFARNGGVQNRDAGHCLADNADSCGVGFCQAVQRLVQKALEPAVRQTVGCEVSAELAAHIAELRFPVARNQPPCQLKFRRVSLPHAIFSCGEMASLNPVDSDPVQNGDQTVQGFFIQAGHALPEIKIEFCGEQHHILAAVFSETEVFFKDLIPFPAPERGVMV